MDNIIYVLVNEAMPGYVKIGKTSDLEQRIRSLYVTGVPWPFECVYACTVENGKNVEDWLFDIFKPWRINPGREFFEVPPESVVTTLQVKKLKDITPSRIYTESKEEEAALNRARTNRDKFNFRMVDIPVGAELVFSRDENIKARVVDNRSIEFRGKVMSLGKAADSILKYKHKVAGTLYWMYEGETLDKRRRRFESGE